MEIVEAFHTIQEQYRQIFFDFLLDGDKRNVLADRRVVKFKRIQNEVKKIEIRKF